MPKDRTVKKSRRLKTPDGVFDMRVMMLGKSQLPGSTNTASNIADPFTNSYSGDKILAPPYNPLTLSLLIEQSPPLAQCIRAMVNNVHGFGWGLKRIEKYRNEKELPPEAEVERQRVSALLNYCNRKEDFTTLRKSVGFDYESTGMGYKEIVRNPLGKIAELHRLPSHTMRMTARDDNETKFLQPIRNTEGKYDLMPRRAKFRRYVQIVDANKKVYFKEYGDPRTISAATGKEVGNNSGVTLANEVLVFSQPCSHSVYGVPRWMPNLMGILGARKAESVNYLFFDNKTIPPLVITVSGGGLVKGTLEKLTRMFETEIKGVENFHKAIVLEGIPADVGEFEGEKASTMRIDVKPLTQFIEKDAQFLEYQAKIDKAIGASFLLPPIYRGMSDDYNRATSMEAARVAEQQVFEPERKPFDYLINTTIMADMEINYWDFYSLGAKTSDTATQLRSVSGVKEAVTVGTIQEMVSDMRNVPLAEMSEDLKTLTLAELNAQLTPAFSEPGEPKEPAEKTLQQLMEIRKAFEERLTEGQDDGDSSL